MAKLVDLQIKDSKNIYLKYSDGIEGEVSLEKVSKNFGFENLNDEEYFKMAKIDSVTNDVTWGDGVSVCKNALHSQLELKSMMKRLHIDLDKDL